MRVRATGVDLNCSLHTHKWIAGRKLNLLDWREIWPQCMCGGPQATDKRSGSLFLLCQARPKCHSVVCHPAALLQSLRQWARWLMCLSVYTSLGGLAAEWHPVDVGEDWRENGNLASPTS